MSELDTFRTEIRSWLEKSTPASLRGRPILMVMEGADEEAAEIRADRKRYLEAHGGARLHRADVAQGVRRRRAVAAAGARAARRDGRG